LQWPLARFIAVIAAATIANGGVQTRYCGVLALAIARAIIP
jgi:hypothetical protein